MYESSQKKNSSWTPSTVQKKGKSPSKLGHFSIQPKPHHTSAPSQEIGEYSRDSADRLTANVMRSLQTREQELAEESTLQPKFESPWAPTFEPPPPLPESPASKLKGAFASVSENQIQRQCAECAKEEVEQKGEERKDLDETGIQTKLTLRLRSGSTVGAPGDAYEQEADSVETLHATSLQVMSMPDNSPQVQKYSDANDTHEIWKRAQSIKPVVQRVVDPSVEMGQMVQRALAGARSLNKNPLSLQRDNLTPTLPAKTIEEQESPATSNKNPSQNLPKYGGALQKLFSKSSAVSQSSENTEVNNDPPWESTLHQDYEQIAKRDAYENQYEYQSPCNGLDINLRNPFLIFNSPILRALQRCTQGYQIKGYHVDKIFEDKDTGLYAFALVTEDGRPPVIVFRGTELSLPDIKTDLDPRGHGYEQFEALQENTEFESWLAAQEMKPDVIGHSLGGALAQLAAANYPGQVGDVVTFNSPGIDADSVDEYKQNDEKREDSEVYHYIVEGDKVSEIGEEFLPGHVTEISGRKFIPGIRGILNHTESNLLTNESRDKNEGERPETNLKYGWQRLGEFFFDHES